MLLGQSQDCGEIDKILGLLGFKHNVGTHFSFQLLVYEIKAKNFKNVPMRSTLLLEHLSQTPLNKCAKFEQI